MNIPARWRFKKAGAAPKKFEDRLLQKIKKTAGCWFWMAYRNPLGYGQIKIPGHGAKLASRVVWEHFVGPIPNKMCVLHKCDNPTCVNPDHLFLGTKLDNSRDMISKGRFPRGTGHWQAKLKESDIPKIVALRKSGKAFTAIARIFNVNRESIRQIVIGNHWMHVPRE